MGLRLRGGETGDDNLLLSNPIESDRRIQKKATLLALEKTMDSRFETGVAQRLQTVCKILVPLGPSRMEVLIGVQQGIGIIFHEYLDKQLRLEEVFTFLGCFN